MKTSRLIPLLASGCLLMVSAAVQAAHEPGATATPHRFTTSQQDAKKTPAKDQKKARVQWPVVKPVRLSIAKDKVRQLAHKKEGTRKKAKATIVRYGPGCTPVLIKALKDSLKPELKKAITALADEMLEPKYAPLVAELWTGTNKTRDLYILRTVRRLAATQHVKLFAKGIVHGDPEIREEAVFALAKCGDKRALHPLLLLARDSWDEKNYPIREALPSLKNEACSSWLRARLSQGELIDKVAVLRLLHGVGDKDSVSDVARFLDAKEHQLRAEAVNALRGIVDGEPPFHKLSVFKAIEEVKRWKARVGR